MRPIALLKLTALLLVGSGAGFLLGEEKPRTEPLINAHAHNDYYHARPLLDALDHGFSSVEADIHLVGGKLLVAHDRIEIRPGRTLEALYLDPLLRLARANRGRVHRNGPEFTLLIDIKSDGEKTYKALREVLSKYAEMLTTVRDGKLETRAVRVVISGNRPRELISRERTRYAGIDGRIKDLESSEPGHLVPLISDNWRRHFKWRGAGPMADTEKRKLRKIVKRAHRRGRRVRFWATPENPALWKELMDAGVDLINTDDLKGLQEFLLSRKKKKRAEL